MKVPGVTVDDIPIYDTFYETDNIVDIRGGIENGEIDFAVFTSASTVRGFAESLPGADLSKVSAICIGRQTEAQAKAYGMRTRTAKKATMESVVQCVREAAAIKKEEMK